MRSTEGIVPVDAIVM